jgi:hypothetical protein
MCSADRPLAPRVRLRRLTESQLKKCIKGTFLATLLLAAQEGGKPLNEAVWILVGAILVTVVDAYASHIAGSHEGGVSAYFASLFRGIVNDLPRIAALPTVLILVLAAIFHWGHDHRNPDGSVTAGYETLGLNINVVLLFVFGILAAHRSGSSVRGTILFALMNAALGWLIVVIELELE